MKIRLICCLLPFAFAAAMYFSSNARADNPVDPNSQTNVFSLSWNDVRDETGKEQSYFVNCLVHHIEMPETLPPDLDTNGNWGAATNGLQFSLRFRREEFTVGEAVPAISIIRNLECHSQTLLVTDSPSFFLKLAAYYGTNALPERHKNQSALPAIVYTDGSSMPSPPHGFLNWTLRPRSGFEVALDLNHFFDLSRAGTYTVMAKCRVYSPVTKLVSYEVESGAATFTISGSTNSL